MSLNSVVNNLVRAAAGIPTDISDADLDAHVAQLLADEAKAKEKNWTELGLSGLLRDGRDSPDPNAPKPNKRFLASVIRTVDGHNTALLRAQAEAARDLRDQRGESSRSAAGRLFGGALRGVEGNSRSSRRRDDRDRTRAADSRREEVYRDRVDRETESRRRYDTRDRIRLDDDWRHDRHDHSRKSTELEEEAYLNRSRGDERDERRRREHDEEAYHNDKELTSQREEDERYRRRQKEKRGSEAFGSWRGYTDRKEKSREADEHEERSPLRRKGRSRQDPPPPDGALSDGDGRKSQDFSAPEDLSASDPVSKTKTAEQSHRSHGFDESKSEEQDDKNRETRRRRRNPSRSASPPLKQHSPISKMDKYFAREYDPRLDLGEVPSEGFVAEVGWDNMLAILKERGQKRRHQSPTLSDDGYQIPRNVTVRQTSPETGVQKLEKADRRKRKEERRKRRGSDDESDGERERRKEKKRKQKALASEATVAEGAGLLDVAYVKKGGVREWDVGK